MNKSDFDLDFRYGYAGEIYVNNLLAAPIETVECKRDSRWTQTGNIFIETHYWSRTVYRWVESGITTTRASHWSFILERLVLTVPVDIVRKALNEYGYKLEAKLEPNPSRGFLITINGLIMAMKGNSDG